MADDSDYSSLSSPGSGDEEYVNEDPEDETSQTGGFKGNRIFSITRDLEDLNYHLASVFPSFTNKQLALSKAPPKTDTNSK